jgi:hypothetical protein
MCRWSGIDFMTSIKDPEQKSFDECYNYSRIADFDDIKVPFLHINDLIANKKAAGRPKDQIDNYRVEKNKKIPRRKPAKIRAGFLLNSFHLPSIFTPSPLSLRQISGQV